MKYKPKLQKRFWLGTVWIGHTVDGKLTPDELRALNSLPTESKLEQYREWFSRVAQHPAVQWIEGQIEVGSESDSLHIQVALKTHDSKRWEWMSKNLKASWQPADNWNAVSNYCVKKSDRVEYLGAHGKKPDSKKMQGDGSAKLRALNFLRNGKSPDWIARNDMQAFFTHHNAIITTYKALLIADRRKHLEEE